MKTPVTKEKLSQHFTYSWWKYLLVAALSIFAVTLLYDMTRYQPPAEKKVDFYVYGYANQEVLNAYMEQVRVEKMPDMEEMCCLQLTTDETYGAMQLTVYMGAGEGDLYLLPRDEFISYAGSGAFRSLDDQTELLALLENAGVSLSRGKRTISKEDDETSDGQPHLYGIPIEKIPGISEYVWAKDGFLCVFTGSGNDENVVKFLNIFISDLYEKDAAAQAASAETVSDDPAPAASQP